MAYAPSLAPSGEVMVNGYVDEVVIAAGPDEIARHRRSRQSAEFVFDPLHYLALPERKAGALDQAAPLQGWDPPTEFGAPRRLLEARLSGKNRCAAGKRDCVQVLRLARDLPDACPAWRHQGCAAPRCDQL